MTFFDRETLFMAKKNNTPSVLPEQNSLANRINDLRIEKGLSYTELARQLGVSRQTAANYCSGQTATVPRDKLEALSRVFGVSPAFLLSESDIRSENPMIKAACDFTKLSQEAAIKLASSSVASYVLTYLLENTEEDFWRTLQAYFNTSVPREDTVLEVDPYMPVVKKFQKDYPKSKEGFFNGTYVVENRKVILLVLFENIRQTLSELRKGYWKWVVRKEKEEAVSRVRPQQKTRSAEMLDRIERVMAMEKHMNRVIEDFHYLGIGLGRFKTAQRTLRYLDQYYQSEDWKEDFEADEAGKFPPDLPRGVLSEDGIYNLLEQNKDLWERLRTFAEEASKREKEPDAYPQKK